MSLNFHCHWKSSVARFRVIVAFTCASIKCATNINCRPHSTYTQKQHPIASDFHSTSTQLISPQRCHVYTFGLMGCNKRCQLKPVACWDLSVRLYGFHADSQDSAKLKRHVDFPDFEQRLYLKLNRLSCDWRMLYPKLVHTKLFCAQCRDDQMGLMLPSPLWHICLLYISARFNAPPLARYIYSKEKYKKPIQSNSLFAFTSCS